MLAVTDLEPICLQNILKCYECNKVVEVVALQSQLKLFSFLFLHRDIVRIWCKVYHYQFLAWSTLLFLVAGLRSHSGFYCPGITDLSGCSVKIKRGWSKRGLKNSTISYQITANPCCLNNYPIRTRQCFHGYMHYNIGFVKPLHFRMASVKSFKNT